VTYVDEAREAVRLGQALNACRRFGPRYERRLGLWGNSDGPIMDDREFIWFCRVYGVEA
jgi:hypothetical protein